MRAVKIISRNIYIAKSNPSLTRFAFDSLDPICPVHGPVGAVYKLIPERPRSVLIGESPRSISGMEGSRIRGGTNGNIPNLEQFFAIKANFCEALINGSLVTQSFGFNIGHWRTSESIFLTY